MSFIATFLSESASIPGRGISSPCIGMCTTSFGDYICRGCKRFDHEIRDWHSYDDAEKQAVISRIEGYRIVLLQNLIEITDADLLAAALKKRGLPLNRDAHPSSWLFLLLLRSDCSGLDAGACGFRLKTSRSLKDIQGSLESDLYGLSRAYYQRYCNDLHRSAGSDMDSGANIDTGESAEQSPHSGMRLHAERGGEESPGSAGRDAR